jgi:hypothetical protein
MQQAQIAQLQSQVRSNQQRSYVIDRRTTFHRARRFDTLKADLTDTVITLDHNPTNLLPLRRRIELTYSAIRGWHDTRQ